MIILVLVFFSTQLKHYEAPKIKEISQQEWLSAQVIERNNWLNVPKQAFQVRFHGDIKVMSSSLKSLGWNEIKPNAWKDVWNALRADEKDEKVPFIPTTNNGKIETVIYTKRIDDNLFALHLWERPLKITSSDQHLYAGYVSQNHIGKNWGLTFWKNSYNNDAILTFIKAIEKSNQLYYSKSDNQFFIQVREN